MTMFFVAIFICFMPMLNGMEAGSKGSLLFKKNEHIRKKLLAELEGLCPEPYEKRNGSCYARRAVIGFVWNADGDTCGNVILESSSLSSNVEITLERYRFSEKDEIERKSVSWNDSSMPLHFFYRPFFNESDDFCYYRYNRLRPEDNHLSIIEYSLSKKGFGATFPCMIDFSVPYEKDSNKKPLLASLGYIDEKNLLQVFFESPSVKYNGQKVYPMTQVIFPEQYESRAMRADRILDAASFLVHTPEIIRRLMVQALFSQRLCNKLKMLVEK